MFNPDKAIVTADEDLLEREHHLLNRWGKRYCLTHSLHSRA